MLQIIAAISASILGIVTTLCMLLMLAAGLANAKPKAIQQAKWMAWGVVLVQMLSLAGAIWLMVHRQHWYAAAVGITPVIVIVVLVTVLVKIRW